MSHSHHSPPDGRDSQRAIGVAFWLNFGFALIEFAGGWWTQSTAILADAVHDAPHRDVRGNRDDVAGAAVAGRL